jgi:nucleoside phosphorylase
MPAHVLNPQDYRVGWICAVQTEYVVACEFLDEEHPEVPSSSEHDDNTYTLGRIGDHNVVIACLPKGKYGLTSAASVAKDMLRTFPSIRIGLMVGIGGGAPTKKHDIRLGDVVVSSPVRRSGGVIHYDFGRTVQDKAFERTGSLDAPPPMLLTALNKLNALHERKGHQIASSVEQMVHQNPRLKRKYQRPDPSTDVLYEATFIHADASEECQVSCDAGTSNVIARDTRDVEQDDPVIHYGLIASADRLMKDAGVRDLLAEKEQVLCFEMEAAGLMDQFPCVVIRGICDYSDTHKNDRWQGYAAATAAAYAKELLNVIPGHHVVQREPILSPASQAQSTSFSTAKLPLRDTNQRKQPPGPAPLDLSNMVKAIDESQTGDSTSYGRFAGVETNVDDIRGSNDARMADLPGHGNPVGVQDGNKTIELGESNAMASNEQAAKSLPLVVRKSGLYLPIVMICISMFTFSPIVSSFR